MSFIYDTGRKPRAGVGTQPALGEKVISVIPNDDS
jgi:hypothetical protein